MLKRIATGMAIAGIAVTAYASEPRKATLEVKGMSCAACPLTVKAVLRKQEGVEDVKMDAVKHTAEVAFDPAKVSQEQLAKAVSEAGFPASPRK